MPPSKAVLTLEVSKPEVIEQQSNLAGSMQSLTHLICVANSNAFLLFRKNHTLSYPFLESILGLGTLLLFGTPRQFQVPFVQSLGYFFFSRQAVTSGHVGIKSQALGYPLTLRCLPPTAFRLFRRSSCSVS